MRFSAVVALHEGVEVYAFTRDGDREGQEFAKKMGAVWAGGSTEPCPVRLDAATFFAPDGKLVPKALADTIKGGRVVSGGIQMSDIPEHPGSGLLPGGVV
jgi:propanol-preferring alcohol dehydrogenase